MFLTKRINIFFDQAGCEGDVEEAQGVLKLCDQFRDEREQLKKQIGNIWIDKQTFRHFEKINRQVTLNVLIIYVIYLVR